MKPLRQAAIMLSAVLFSGYAFGQEGTLDDELIGTWSYVAADNVGPGGERTPLFGPNPRGLVMFQANGRYMLMTERSDLPRFAANNRNEGTADENRAVVQGSIAHFGTYTVDDENMTITFHIEGSTFPNWIGVEQTRPFTITGNELRWRTAASSGGVAEIVLVREQDN